MTDITADADTLMRQGGMTAHTWLMQAVEYIDQTFGEGHAKRNPALVAGFIQAAAMDCGSAVIAQQVRLGLDAIAAAVERDEP